MADESKKPPVTTDEIATVEKDIDVFAGWLKRLENPDPVLRAEAAGKGLKLYDEVDRDAHAGSVIQQRILAVVGKEWEIIPAKTARKSGRPASTTREEVVADFVSEVLENSNFDQARQELLRGILYGYYCAEVIWKVSGSDVVVGRLIGKHPRRFIFTPERELRLLTPSSMIDGEAVPDRKFIVYAYGDSDNPYGRGLGQKLWWPVWFKKNGIKFWVVFLEKFGIPTVKGKYPPGTTPEQQQALMDAIEAIQSDTGIKIPDSMDIEFLEASRAGTVTHEQLCEYMDRQISKAVLGQTASTEGTPGKLGNEKSQEDVRQEIIEADADLLDGCLNDTLIRWIVDYNFPGVVAYPKIKTFAAPKPDLVAQVEIDKTLVVDIRLPVSQAYFYETYGIPAPEEGEELVTPAPKSSFGPNGGERSLQDNTAGFSEGKAGDAADRIADRTARDVAPATDAYVESLRRLAERARSLEELRDGIIDLFGEMDSAELGAAIARGMSLAELAGRYEVAAEAGILGGGKKKALKKGEFAEGGDSELYAVFGKPFDEANRFFQNKLNIPTRKWDDLWKDQHAKGFMIAGAYKADLLADFRSAVDRAIAQGTTLETFRKDFDAIVASHGWSYKGSRNWRSQVIYATNVRTAYAAGRWQQLTDPELQEVMPYLTYRHGDSMVPRPEHLAWDGITLPADDPWWDTHYVPNGWGCKCRVFGATRAEYQRAKEKGLGEAPPSPIDPKTGEPVGIDKGWGYNVGKAASEEGYRVLTEKFESLPNEIARKWIASYVTEPAFQRFIAGEIKGEFPVAVLDRDTMKALGTGAQSVWLSDDTLAKNKENHPDIGLTEFKLISEILDKGEIYRQGENRLIYLATIEKLYRAAVKRSKAGSENYFLTLFKTTDEVAERNVRSKSERVR